MTSTSTKRYLKIAFIVFILLWAKFSVNLRYGYNWTEWIFSLSLLIIGFKSAFFIITNNVYSQLEKIADSYPKKQLSTFDKLSKFIFDQQNFIALGYGLMFNQLSENYIIKSIKHIWKTWGGKDFDKKSRDPLAWYIAKLEIVLKDIRKTDANNSSADRQTLISKLKDYKKMRNDFTHWMLLPRHYGSFSQYYKETANDPKMYVFIKRMTDSGMEVISLLSANFDL